MNKESFHINSEDLLKKVKELIAEGNIRKITITDKSGKELMSFPLTMKITISATLVAWSAIRSRHLEI